MKRTTNARLALVSAVLVTTALALPASVTAQQPAAAQPAADPTPAAEPAPPVSAPDDAASASVGTTVSPGDAATATGVSTSAGATTQPDDRWTIGVAPRIGVTIPTSRLETFVVGGLELDYVPGPLGRRLVLALDVSLTRPSHDRTVDDPRVGGMQTYEIQETELKVALDAVYRIFPDGRRLVPFAGAGALVHMLRTRESTSFAPGRNSSRSTEVGFELLGGVDYRIGPGFAVGAVRIVYSDLDHLFTGDAHTGAFESSLGYRLVF